MHASRSPVLRDLILVGGGHSHVGVLRRFAMKPEPGVRLTVVSTDVDTPYSGMLPGYIAGHYTFDEVHIDLGRLAAWAGARFIRAGVTGIDRGARRVLFQDRPAVPYDVLSVNTGSTPDTSGIPGAAEHAVPVKPIAGFDRHWQHLLERVRDLRAPMTVAVVGGGAGGVELLLAMQFRLRRELEAQGRSPELLRCVLVTAGPTILPTHNAGVRRRFEAVLRDRQVRVYTQAEVVGVTVQHLRLRDGRAVDADRVLWVTQAAGPAWLQDTGLALDAQGFVRVGDTLQSVSDPAVFAAGDVAAFTTRPLEKAGVFAVRMGRPLAVNLRRVLRGERPVAWRPQRHWLALISTGDRYAVASRGALGCAGAWVWRCKDAIDRRFMRRFSVFPAMDADAADASNPPHAHALALSAAESLQALSAVTMRCGGCGAKVGASVLTRALSSLRPIERDDVVIGLHAPDDAAVVRVPPGMAAVYTVDFFRAFIDDPYLFGKVAANHALGDIFAMGAEPQSATAIATVPPGIERQVEDLLLQMMTGAVEVLNAAGCALVGGHTGEGQELALGFAINGLIPDSLDGVMRKGGMRPGDALILTKAIGTGTLFAAQARYAARGRWIDAALGSMVLSNRAGSHILREHGVTACTDLTGFGLLGHLVEMTRPSGVDVELELGALPLLDGALECVALGILSSLQPANLRLRRALRNGQDHVADPRYPLLFDPQTAGGLLASVPAQRVQACIRALHEAGYPRAAVIGRVLPMADALAPVTLRASEG